VARSIGLPEKVILSPQQIADSGIDGVIAARRGFHEDSPLWYYLMKEAAEFEGGRRLGPVGGRLVAEVIVGLIQGDGNSYLASNPSFRPTLPRRDAETFTFVDLLNVASDPRLRGP
jgi:hypothetical protein